MSTNHHERIERVIDKALKEAALGEPYGFAVNGPGFWKFFDPKGNVLGEGVGWSVMVTIRAAGLGEPDLGQMAAMPGVLPGDADFGTLATRLLEQCRNSREQVNMQAMQQAGMEAFTRKVKDAPQNVGKP